MQKSVLRFSFVVVSCALLAACGHDNEMAQIGAPKEHYVLQSQRGAEQVTTAGFVSRYQRELMVQVSNEEYASSPAAQNFDHIMDHLETLMAPQIAENNRIAALQAEIPGYRF